MTRLVRRPVARPVVRAVAMLTLAGAVSLIAAVPARAAIDGELQSVADAVDVADTVPPTQPTNFRVVTRTRSGSITLGWDASYDAVGVAGYRLYRNGTWSGTLYQAGVDLIGTVMFDRLGGRTKTAVTYDLYAFDAAGNVSAPARLVVTP